MTDFLEMGGYAAFIWPAYLISAVTIGGLVYFVMRRARKARQRLASAEERTRVRLDQ